MIYVAVFLFLCLLVPFGGRDGRKNIGLLVAVCAALFIFVGFRWEVGCDWTGYLNIFDIARRGSVEESLSSREPGFALLNHFAHALGLDYFFINVAGAFVFFLGLYLFAKREENPLAVIALSFPVLIMNMPMSGVRQGMAIGLLMIAINAYRDRRPLVYAIIVLAASTFHQSALLFLALTPLVGFKRNATTTLFVLILAAPGAYFIFADALGYYVERYGEGAADAFGAPFRAALLGIVGVAFFALLRKRWRKEYAADYELFVIACALMLLILPVTLFNSIVGDRIGYYLIPFQLVVLTRMGVLFRRDKLAPLFMLGPYVALVIFFLGWTRLSDHFEICYVPYDSMILGVE